MSNFRYWAPRTVDLPLAIALAVKCVPGVEMTEQQHRLQLESKLREQAAGKVGASEELIPDLQLVDRKGWAMTIMHSDPMMAALAKIDWSKEPKGLQVSQSLLQETLPEQSLEETLAAL